MLSVKQKRNLGLDRSVYAIRAHGDKRLLFVWIAGEQWIWNHWFEHLGLVRTLIYSVDLSSTQHGIKAVTSQVFWVLKHHPPNKWQA